MSEQINQGMSDGIALVFARLTRTPEWFSSAVFDRTVAVGRVRLKVRMKRSDGLMGRFGGGWNWKLGIAASRTTVVLDLFVMSVRVAWDKS